MKIQKINRRSIGISGFTSVLTPIPSPPHELFVVGSLPKKRIKSVAIIGSRKPTAYGIEITHTIAYELAKRGIIIISGLAYGIDAIAHKAALEAGGTTIAVLAGGLHRIYPATHTGLAQRIVNQGGALLSEKPPGEDARHFDFLKRNRLVSGLADAVIVTEATEKSGTLSTVQHALEQGKDVCAVPGSVLSLLSAGPNSLLQQGAHVVRCAQDVLSLIAPEMPPLQAQLPLGDTPLETRIISLIQEGVRTAEALIHALAPEPPSQITQTFTTMELKGTLAITQGRFSLRP